MTTKIPPELVDDQIIGRRNLIINGDMRIAQRSTSSTGNGDYVLDRFYNDYNGGTVTFAQSALSSSDTPYTHGFRKSLKVTNTSAGSDAAANYVRFQQRIEAQNLANSGWNYTSDTSFVTLSFWVKSSLAGTYAVTLQNIESSASEDYSFEFTLTANTWQKVTHAIKGNSEIVFDDDSGEGLRIMWFPHIGTNYTTSSNTLETWGAYTATDQTKDYAQNWSATASATFEVTGVQLEVGSQATTFEHRSISEELALCKRYFQKHTFPDSAAVMNGCMWLSTSMYGAYHFYPTTRVEPTTTISAGATFDVLSPSSQTGTSPTTATAQNHSNQSVEIYLLHSSSLGTQGDGVWVRSDTYSGETATFTFDAEFV